MHSEEDAEGGKEEPKDHSSRTADFSCVLGSHKFSKSPIRHDLHTNRLFGRVARRKPLLRATNKFKHREFAKCHWNYDWNRMLWSDGHIHRRHVCRQKRDTYKEKHLIPTIKYGGGSLGHGHRKH